MKVLLFFCLIAYSSFGLCDGLKPFTSDGCSVFPDGTPKQQDLWLNCCIRHDLAYWKGGTFEQRQQADNQLKVCVNDLGMPEIARLMHTGVRIGGTPWLPTGYRWGYGWPYLRGYKPLDKKELEAVKLQLRRLEIMIEALREEIEK